jgi:hypothetical protein
MAETAVKYFTLEEANATLPYVRRVVEDIVAEYLHWKDRIFAYEKLAANAPRGAGETDEQLALREEVDAIARRINQCVSELQSVGCIFKGFDGGLVDFCSQRGGRDIYLCWKLGEPEIGHWHEIDAGFAGRRPIATLESETEVA